MIPDVVKNDRLIEENLGLVYACANRFRGRGEEYEDLVQAGCIGLIRAARGFEPERGFAFSTYAVPSILGEMKRLFRDGGSVKVGRSLKERAMHASRKAQELREALDREPTIDELALSLGCDTAEAAQLVCVSLPTISLTADDDGDGAQLDIAVPAHDEETTQKIALGEALTALPERDRKIIELRYLAGKTQCAAAESLGMTQVQVSRAEKRILLTLRGFLAE